MTAKNISLLIPLVLEKVENKNELTKQIAIATGKEMHIKYIDLKASNSKKEEEASTENLNE